MRGGPLAFLSHSGRRKGCPDVSKDGRRFFRQCPIVNHGGSQRMHGGITGTSCSSVNASGFPCGFMPAFPIRIPPVLPRCEPTSPRKELRSPRCDLISRRHGFISRRSQFILPRCDLTLPRNDVKSEKTGGVSLQMSLIFARPLGEFYPAGMFLPGGWHASFLGRQRFRGVPGVRRVRKARPAR